MSFIQKIRNVLKQVVPVVGGVGAGVGSTAGIMSGVGAYGTTGTGIAIAELSGGPVIVAELTLIGGTLAAGPLVLTGMGILVAGLVGYGLWKLMN